MVPFNLHWNVRLYSDVPSGILVTVGSILMSHLEFWSLFVSLFADVVPRSPGLQTGIVGLPKLNTHTQTANDMVAKEHEFSLTSSKVINRVTY